MSYANYILRDHPIGLWMLDESSGDFVHDSSSAGNNGSYDLSIDSSLYMPLVRSAGRACLVDESQTIYLPILNNYLGQESSSAFADKYSSDNDFTLEAWVYFKNITETTNIFYSNLNLTDDTPAVGIYYTSNAIYFKVNSEYIVACPENLKERMHLVATYSPDHISLYINGILKATKQLTNFKFVNDNFNEFLIGPTALSESMLVNAAAIYRYNLTDKQILDHFNAAKTMNPLQIVFKEDGTLFTGSDFETRKVFEYSYPTNKTWAELNLSSSFYHNKEADYVTLSGTINSDSFYDYFSIPDGLDLISSKVEWDFDNNINVFVSESGETGTYIKCNNGSALPQWILGEETFNNSRTIYIQVELLSDDSTLIKPQLNNLNFYFYSEKDIYAKNYGDYISLEQPQGGTVDTTVWDVSGSTKDYDVLSRNNMAGLKPESEAGFVINTGDAIYTIEMVYKASETLSPNTLFSNTDAWFSWDSAGLIDVSGPTIYVNGVYKTASQIQDILEPGETYHIIMVLQEPITDKVYINSKVLNNVWSNNGSGHSYSNIAIYDSVFTLSQVEEHYNLYTSGTYSYSDPVSITMTETGVFAYDYDWKVVKSV